MAEREGFDVFDEGFANLQIVQEALAKRGYLFYPVAKEHTEALVIGPLLHRIRTQIKKRGFANVAARVALTFSGFAGDPREVYAISEARAYWQALDAQLPELPALLTTLHDFRYNGPGMQLTMLGEIETVIHRPNVAGYDVQVLNGPALIADATRRIQQAGRTYHLSDTAVANLVDHFQRGATHHL